MGGGGGGAPHEHFNPGAATATPTATTGTQGRPSQSSSGPQTPSTSSSGAVGAESQGARVSQEAGSQALGYREEWGAFPAWRGWTLISTVCLEAWEGAHSAHTHSIQEEEFLEVDQSNRKFKTRQLNATFLSA